MRPINKPLVDKETKRSCSPMSHPSSRIVSELLRIGAYLQRNGGRITKRYGLSQQHFVVLKAIQEQGEVSQKHIRTTLLYEKSNVSKAVTKLLDSGFITTRQSDEDARIILCSVTESGVRIIDSCMRDFNQWNVQWLEQLRPVDKDVLLTLLKSLGRMEDQR